MSKILTPTEWESIRSHLNPFYQILSDAYLYTGMEPTEFWEFTQNTHWYLPAWHRIKLNHERREIFLSIEGTKAMDVFVAAINGGTTVYRDRASFRDTLMRAATVAGIELEGINPMMFRKTLSAWLVAIFPEKWEMVVRSMGCTVETIRETQKERKFSREDLTKIRNHLQGWGE